MKGGKTFTGFTMKKQVRWGSKAGARRTATRAPENKAMRRQKARGTQSCRRVSEEMLRKGGAGAEMKKCMWPRIRRRALRVYVLVLKERKRQRRSSQSLSSSQRSGKARGRSCTTRTKTARR